eukprot:4843633-Alexandrium_andersonii.AAC.1
MCIRDRCVRDGSSTYKSHIGEPQGAVRSGWALQCWEIKGGRCTTIGPEEPQSKSGAAPTKEHGKLSERRRGLKVLEMT